VTNAPVASQIAYDANGNMVSYYPGL